MLGRILFEHMEAHCCHLLTPYGITSRVLISRYRKENHRTRNSNKHYASNTLHTVSGTQERHFSPAKTNKTSPYKVIRAAELIWYEWISALKIFFLPSSSATPL